MYRYAHSPSTLSCKLLLGDHATAVPLLQKAVELAGTSDPNPRLELGRVYQRLDKVEEAYQEYRTLLSQFPNHLQGLWALHHLCYTTNKIEESQNYLNQLRSLDHEVNFQQYDQLLESYQEGLCTDINNERLCQSWYTCMSCSITGVGGVCWNWYV